MPMQWAELHEIKALLAYKQYEEGQFDTITQAAKFLVEKDSHFTSGWGSVRMKLQNIDPVFGNNNEKLYNVSKLTKRTCCKYGNYTIEQLAAVIAERETA